MALSFSAFQNLAEGINKGVQTLEDMKNAVDMINQAKDTIIGIGKSAKNIFTGGGGSSSSSGSPSPSPVAPSPSPSAKSVAPVREPWQPFYKVQTSELRGS